MVDRPETIRNIIEGLTNYSGNYFSTVSGLSKVDETLPKFYVEQIHNRNNNDNVQQSQFFRIELQADSLANLTTQIKVILALQTNSTAGYNPAANTGVITYKIKAAIDDISRSSTNEASIYNGTFGWISGRDVSEGYYYTMLRFKPDGIKIHQGATINSATLKATAADVPSGTENNPPDFRINGYLGGSIPSPTDTLETPWTANNTITQYSDATAPQPWVTDTEYSLTTSDINSILEIIQECVDDPDFDGDIGLFFAHELGGGSALRGYGIYTYDASNTNPTKYTEIDINYDFSSDYPYWIKLDLIDEPYNPNEFKALIECEARWTI